MLIEWSLRNSCREHSAAAHAPMRDSGGLGDSRDTDAPPAVEFATATREPLFGFVGVVLDGRWAFVVERPPRGCSRNANVSKGAAVCSG